MYFELYILQFVIVSQVGKSACIVLAKERHSKGERVPFSAYTPKYTKLKPEAANTLSLMFQIFLEKNYRTPCCPDKVSPWLTFSNDRIAFDLCALLKFSLGTSIIYIIPSPTFQ